MKTLPFILFLFLNGIEIKAQSILESDQVNETKDIRKERPLGISAALGGPSLLGGPSMNYFANPQLNLKFTLAPFEEWQGFAVGVNYHFKKSYRVGRWSPYAGLEYAKIKDGVDIICFGGCPPDEDLSIWYVPIGIAWMTYWGFTCSVEGAILHSYNLSKNQREYLGPWFGINVGYRFKISEN